jgi:hypothetical protein
MAENRSSPAHYPRRVQMGFQIPPPPMTAPEGVCPLCGLRDKFMNLSLSGISLDTCKRCNKDYFGRARPR